MTDKRPDDADPDDRPIDFHALGVELEQSSEDRVVGGAMARIASLPRRSPAPTNAPLVDDLERWWRPGLAAAATVIVLAGASWIARAPEQRDSTVEAQLLEWAESGYVPRNVDLIAAFTGLDR